MKGFTVAYHLKEIYEEMPPYANDPEQSKVIKRYERILFRYTSLYGHQPKYFVRSPGICVLLGDDHAYVGLPYLAFASCQDIVCAVGLGTGASIRVTNQIDSSHLELSLDRALWKYDDDSFKNTVMKCLSKCISKSNLQIIALDILLAPNFLPDPFLHYDQAVESSLQTAFQCMLKQSPNEKKHQNNFHYGKITLVSGAKGKTMGWPKQLQMVIAHSMTPLPKRLVRGKRFNLRQCEVRIALEILSQGMGITVKSIAQLIGQSSVQQVIQYVKEMLPQDGINAKDIQKIIEKSLIEVRIQDKQVLKEVPYANNVIDQNQTFNPKSRILFFLHEQMRIKELINKMVGGQLEENALIMAIKKSNKEQNTLLQIHSEQVTQMIDLLPSLAHRIIGNGWGGSLLIVCQDQEQIKNILEKHFYQKKENNILLTDQVGMFLSEGVMPANGIRVLDPQSEIWF